MKNPVKASIKTIAAEAKLSIAAVSMALRNHPSIPKETRQRVKEVAQKQHYRPNASAISLRKMRQEPSSGKNIALLIGHPNKELIFGKKALQSYREIIEQSHQRAKSLGLPCTTFWAKDPKIPPDRLNQILQSRGIQGIVAHAMQEEDIAIPWQDFSCVFISPGPSGKRRFNYTVACPYKKVTLAIDELSKIAPFRAGLVINQPTRMRTRYRAEAAYKTLLPQKQQIPLFILKDTSNEHAVQNAFLQWIHKHKPEVVIFNNRPVALQKLDTLGIKVPQELRVIDLEVRNGSTDTGVRSPFRALGAAAVDTLYSQLLRNEIGHPDSPVGIEISPQWIEGETCPK